ncbi:hypothetical protein FE810_00665 [Thalassotalea litorea]|uniref:Uncharacterized protein n=1 Tax=Thalassotalea litorea TaxID=2020715 RepID=A0A5R9IVU6_9GAMM|nr:hypothetical protein [Thalassotalea litorea]TLU67501.1 hypothetical protein FE810_00665 [Thalassotalea litorea]
MFSNLVKPKPIIDTQTKQWIDDAYAWLELHFVSADPELKPCCILPTNDYYPGRVGSVDEMAQSIFIKTAGYAGMRQWPVALRSTRLGPPPVNNALPQLSFPSGLRGSDIKVINNDFSMQGAQPMVWPYQEQQINHPQLMIANFAQGYASLLMQQTPDNPPGGEEFRNQTIELLACYLGFGVMMANTAYQFRGGCGSCYSPSANRQTMLTEEQTVYALALHCRRNELDTKPVRKQLKSHLQKDFKRALKQVENGA